MRNLLRCESIKKIVEISSFKIYICLLFIETSCILAVAGVPNVTCSMLLLPSQLLMAFLCVGFRTFASFLANVEMSLLLLAISFVSLFLPAPDIPVVAGISTVILQYSLLLLVALLLLVSLLLLVLLLAPSLLLGVLSILYCMLQSMLLLHSSCCCRSYCCCCSFCLNTVHKKVCPIPPYES